MPSEDSKRSLTRYPSGSIRELWHLTWPLILTTASSYLMMLCDRVILARYSSGAMNAVATTGLAFATFQYGFMAIALIAEVFVGRYNGRKEYVKIGPAVWQMIWFSFASALFFIPTGIYAAKSLVAREFEAFGIPYFQILMCFGPFFCLSGALSTFFIGRGKTRVVTLATIGGVLLNLFLDILLIFGYEPWLPPLGSVGAAIGTGAAQVCEVLVLFAIFLRKENRLNYGTDRYGFQKKLFFKSIKIGYPAGLMHVLEIGAYALLYQLLASVGDAYITTFVIGQNFYLFFCFLTEAIHKAVTAIVSNFIGAKKFFHIPSTLRSSFYFGIVVISIGAILMLRYPNGFIDFFIAKNESGTANDTLREMIRSSLFYFWLVLIFDMGIWIFSGILTAAGDTQFLMLTTTLGTWGLFIFPCLVLIKGFHCSPSLMWKLMPAYLAVILCFYIIRYFRQPWKNLS